MLLDSNIIIYAAKPEHGDLRLFVAQHTTVVSAVSFVEVLGYHKLTEPERLLLETFFATATILPLENAVLERAVKLRQERKLGLGDALVAATALVHRHTLVTRNTKDFDWIAGLTLHNPFVQ